MGSLIDLNELVEKCNDVRVKELLREAVNCYNGGSFRATIVMTWIAVVFDYFYKLDELGQKGEKGAATTSAAFFLANEKQDTPSLLNFENTLINNATEQYGFLSPDQSLELERLYKDRHRCAHPSVTAGHQPYKPSAEQARYHLRNAVEILLACPPTMGTAGVDEIWSYIESRTFPLDAERAKDALRNTNLNRLSSESQKSLALGILITPICEVVDNDLLARIFVAANALNELKPGLIEQIRPAINKKLFGVKDAQRARIYRSFYKIPFFKTLVDAAELDKCIELAAHLNPQTQCEEFIYAASQPEFSVKLSAQIPNIDHEMLTRIIFLHQSSAYLNEAVGRLSAVGSYNLADEVMDQLIIPCAPYFSQSQIKSILGAGATNSQIYDRKKSMSSFVEFYEGCNHKVDLKAEWQALADGRDWGRLSTLIEKCK